MAINDTTREAVEGALAQFDKELRNLPAWRDWENNQSHKFALVHGDRRYPVKQIIAMASGTPTDRFNGGAEANGYIQKLGYEVEPLRLPSEGEVSRALHELLLTSHPIAVSPKDAYGKLADQFHLSGAMRTAKPGVSGENHWENRVRFAQRNLVGAGILDDSDQGIWKLKLSERPRYWVEKTIVQGRPDREHGENALGRALWSPKVARDGADIYSNMRLVKPGDVVFHLIDNRHIVGVSIADGLASPEFVGLNGTDWAEQRAYRVPLRDYVALGRVDKVSHPQSD